MKLCTECKIEKPETDYFQNGKTSTGEIRRLSVCRICTVTANLTRHEARKLGVYTPTCIQKSCAKCRVIKPADQFAKCLMTRDRLQAWCCDCSNQSSLAIYHDIV